MDGQKKAKKKQYEKQKRNVMTYKREMHGKRPKRKRKGRIKAGDGIKKKEKGKKNENRSRKKWKQEQEKKASQRTGRRRTKERA